MWLGVCARRASAVYIHSVSRPGVSCSGRRGREGRYSHVDALELRACMGSAVAGAEVTELSWRERWVRRNVPIQLSCCFLSSAIQSRVLT